MILFVLSLITFPQNYYVGKICLYLPFGLCCPTSWGFPGDSAGRNPPANAGDSSSISGSGRSPGEG